MAELQTQLSNINFMSKERFDSLEAIDDGQLYAVEFPFTDEDLVHTHNDEEINGIKTFNDEIYAPNQVDYTQITNCITEIPQDIKLEVNNDTLTLKAGSKVYVPNGSNVFDEYIIPTDIQTSMGSQDRTCLYFLSPAKDAIERFPMSICFSGTSAPTNFGQYAMWYDTTNNIIKKTADSGSTWNNGASLPIGIFIESTTGATSIDQVFNGFGYIGSTVFALPGVKGLIPNGRNADGSLKNIEFTTSKVSTQTRTTTANYTYAVYTSGTINAFLPYTESETQPSEHYTLWYKPSENRVYSIDNSGTPILNSVLTLFDCTQVNGVVTSFNPKLPFRAIDYNDFNQLNDIVTELDNEAVKITGNQIINGVKTFKDIPYINIGGFREVANIDKGTAPTSSVYGFGNTLYDKNGIAQANKLGQNYISISSDGAVSNSMEIFKPTSGSTECIQLRVGYDSNGNPFTSTPHPFASNTTASNYIASCGWVNDPTKSTNVVHRTGDERIGGSKTFTSTFALEAGSVQPIMKSTSYTKGTAPESDIYMLHRIYRENGNKSVFDEYYYIPKTTNRPTYILRMQNVSSADATGYKDIITAWYDGTNSQYSIQSSKATAPTPVAGSNNTEIATTNWCYDPAKSTNLVHRTGDETIAGTKTFSSTIQGTAYRALWGDLAEYYETDKEYPRGTLVQFGGSKEITIATDNVNAVITSEPGFILNTQQSFNAENSQAIALVGKVPVRAIGKVKKFDYLTLSDIPGVAKVWSAIELPNANVIARALESKNTEGEGLVFCTVKFEL